MSKQMKSIDLRKLATNFAQEKSKEERYWQKNDAKFRAVHQRCANYDEFKQIVEAAHLQPLDRNETLTLERRPISWNQLAANQISSSTGVSSLASSAHHQVNPSTALIKPKNHTEFLQQWRRTADPIKFDYLHQFDTFENLFQIDIPTDLVYELAMLYRSDSSFEDATMVVNLLMEIAKSKRFELMKSFLSEEKKHQLDLLFSRLCSFVHLRVPVFWLRIIYL